MTLQVTDDARVMFENALSKAGLDDNTNVGILVRAHDQLTIDYGITCEASGFATVTVNGVLFYFEPGLPNETWEAHHNGTTFVSAKQ